MNSGIAPTDILVILLILLQNDMHTALKTQMLKAIYLEKYAALAQTAILNHVKTVFVQELQQLVLAAQIRIVKLDSTVISIQLRFLLQEYANPRSLLERHALATKTAPIIVSAVIHFVHIIILLMQASKLIIQKHVLLDMSPLENVQMDYLLKIQADLNHVPVIMNVFYWTPQENKQLQLNVNADTIQVVSLTAN